MDKVKLTILGETIAQHRGKVLLAFSTGLVFCLCAALQWSHRPTPTKPVQIIETAPLLPATLPSETQPDGTTGESTSPTSIGTELSDSVGRAEPTLSPSILSQTKALLRPHPTVGRTAGRKSKDSVRRSWDQPEKANAEIGLVRPGAWAASQPSLAALLPAVPSMISVAPETPVAVRLGETISSQQYRTGDAFRGQLASPLLVHGVVIAPLHAPVLGRIVDAHQAGLLRGPANINLELTHLTTTSGQLVSIQTRQWYEVAPHHNVTRPFGAILGAFSGMARLLVRSASPEPGWVESKTATSLRAKGPAVITLPAGTTIVFRLRKLFPIEAHERARSRP